MDQYPLRMDQFPLFSGLTKPELKPANNQLFLVVDLKIVLIVVDYSLKVLFPTMLTS